jgi:hypothetical protein
MSKALESSLFDYTHQESDHSIAPGQLTTRGFMQHIQLGTLLHSAYGSFLNQLTPRDVYVRSTNYLRTIRVISYEYFFVLLFNLYFLISSPLRHS